MKIGANFIIIDPNSYKKIFQEIELYYEDYEKKLVKSNYYMTQ